MAYLDDFRDFMHYTADIVKYESAYDPATGQIGPATWVSQKVVQCAKWSSSINPRAIADSIRDQVSDVIVISPEDLGGFVIEGDMRIEIDGERYSIVQPDDILGFEDVIQIFAKKDIA